MDTRVAARVPTTPIGPVYHGELVPQDYTNLTGGRRYGFAIMGFNDQYQFYRRLQEFISQTIGYEFSRADEMLAPAGDLRPKVHAAIDGAAFVIGELSKPSPNVFYEVGYAVARAKPVILMVREGVDLPTDLAGVEVIRYADTWEGELIWQEKLRRYLRQHVEGSRSLLHSFVLPEHPDRSYILANPKLPGPDSKFFTFHPEETRTFGDYLGVAGLFGAFASYYGEHFAPELVSAAHALETLGDVDANFYLIGSPKVNKFTRLFLPALQTGDDCWRLDSVLTDEDPLDPPCQLTGRLPNGEMFSRMAYEGPDDYGLIVRGPHPKFPSRLVMILAGPRSLGTGSACLAATKTELIRNVRDAFNDDSVFTDRQRTLWVLVKGVAGPDRHVQSVHVVAAGACGPMKVQRPLAAALKEQRTART